MFRRASMMVMTVVVLAAAGVSAGFAQEMPSVKPDALVKGVGAIAIPEHNGNIGTFDVNVARFGSVLRGGFKFMEFSRTSMSARPVCTIYSKEITGLRFNGSNYATVTAKGVWNGMSADLTVEALDDNPSGDNFRIIARPSGPITIAIIYDVGGGVIKGDLVVYNNVQPVGYAKGYGAIAVGKNIGRFTFAAEATNAGPRGYVYYTEIWPYNSSVAIRPRVCIYMPKIAALKFEAPGDVYIEGMGYLNGQPAKNFVAASDYSMLDWFAPMPDKFSIRAVPVNDTAWSLAGYEAGGPLTFGDITVVIKNAL